ncbi:MAG: hypothetical protein ACRC5G_02735 [Cetobacterium sp.]
MALINQQDVVYTATVVTSNPANAPVTHVWSLPDGGGTITGNNPSSNQATVDWGNVAGTYRVRDTVTVDSNGCPGSTTVTDFSETLIVPSYKYYFEGITNGTAGASGGSVNLASGVSFGGPASNYNLSFGSTNYTATGTITANPGFIIQKVEKYNYSGSLVSTDNGCYGLSSYSTPTNSTYFMASQGVNSGDFETLKIYWITDPNTNCTNISSVTIN